MKRVKNWDKTNNKCEGLKRAFSAFLAANHPTLWKFIFGLQQQQTLTEIRICKIIAGNSRPENAAKHISLGASLKKVLEDYGKRANEQFLDGIASNIYFV